MLISRLFPCENARKRICAQRINQDGVEVHVEAKVRRQRPLYNLFI